MRSGSPGMNLPSRGMCALADDRRGLQDRIAGNPVVILREVADQRDRDEVHHDRVDDFVRAEARLQHAGNARPRSRRHGDAAQRQRTACRRQSEHRHGRQTLHATPPIDPDPRRRERGDVELPFRADVQQAAAKRHGHREPGEDQRRGVETACSRCRRATRARCR